MLLYLVWQSVRIYSSREYAIQEIYKNKTQLLKALTLTTIHPKNQVGIKWIALSLRG